MSEFSNKPSVAKKLQVNDLQIGAVEIKDSDNDNRAKVTPEGDVHVINKRHVIPVVFHDESTEPNPGLEFEVGGYKNLRVGISGTAASHTILFRGESGGVVTALTGIKEDGLVLGVSTNALNEVWEFDISDYDKVWFGLSAVSGGNITVAGKVGN